MSEPRTFDAFSFVVGVLALTSACLVLLDQSGHGHVDGAVAGACLLLALGLTGLTRAVLRLRGPQQPG